MTARNDSGESQDPRVAAPGPVPIDRLSEQARRLKLLTELKSLKDNPLDITISPEDLRSLVWASEDLKKDMDKVKKGMEENQAQLHRLLMKIEAFWGAPEEVRSVQGINPTPPPAP
jgi:hypothetical protein